MPLKNHLLVVVWCWPSLTRKMFHVFTISAPPIEVSPRHVHMYIHKTHISQICTKVTLTENLRGSSFRKAACSFWVAGISGYIHQIPASKRNLAIWSRSCDTCLYTELWLWSRHTETDKHTHRQSLAYARPCNKIIPFPRQP